MLKITNYLWVLALGVSLFACKEEKKFQKTEAGDTEYMIFEGAEEDRTLLQDGDLVEANIYQIVTNSDTTVEPKEFPNPMKVLMADFGPENVSVLKKAAVGDSVIMRMPLTKDMLKGFFPPEKIKEENWSLLCIKVLGARQQSEIDNEKLERFFSSIPEGYTKSEDGFAYKIIEQGDGEPLVAGMNLGIYMTQSVEADGKPIFPARGGGLQTLPLPPKGEDPSLDGLFMAKVGDSISIIYPITSKLKMNMPPSVPENAELKRDVRIVSAVNQGKIDDELIQQYMQEQNMTATKSESGLYYSIEGEGEGEAPAEGDTVVAHYTGTLLSGDKFDSSLDRNMPFEFPLGQGRVIRGWDEGFSYLKVGQKATLLIPSNLGYGTRAAGAKIPANSVLKFEVELLDIKRAGSN